MKVNPPVVQSEGANEDETRLPFRTRSFHIFVYDLWDYTSKVEVTYGKVVESRVYNYNRCVRGSIAKGHDC